MSANQTSYGLKSELARYCLSSERRDTNLKLAWVNSICILFLLIGIVGARRGIISIRNVPPIRQIVPVVVMPRTLPSQATVPQKKEQPRQNQPARIFVALPSAPNISFSVPTIGTLVGSANLASAPPLNPLQAPAQIVALGNTGAGGARPNPPYPQLAMQTGEQGTIVLLLTSDASGNVVSIEVKQSTGFPYLDHASVEYVKTHWHLPTDAGTRLFQTSITFKLQM
ncbi:MAG TPA: TonB family protein [Verrucomicrobiae bacterium]|jgi:protein TonB|nr:TonB family protein [Verrucomicrobiae bacterium]